MHSLETVGAKTSMPGAGQKPLYLRLNSSEFAMDVLDVAMPVLPAFDVRSNERPPIIPIDPPFRFGEVGVKTAVRPHLAEHDVFNLDIIR